MRVKELRLKGLRTAEGKRGLVAEHRRLSYLLPLDRLWLEGGGVVRSDSGLWMEQEQEAREKLMGVILEREAFQGKFLSAAAQGRLWASFRAWLLAHPQVLSLVTPLSLSDGLA